MELDTKIIQAIGDLKYIIIYFEQTDFYRRYPSEMTLFLRAHVMLTQTEH